MRKSAQARKDINFEKRECVVFGKGDKERMVYFDARTKPHLQEYLEYPSMCCCVSSAWSRTNARIGGNGCCWCEVIDGELKLLEAEDAKWLSKDTLYSVQWLPAEITLIEKIEKQMK